VDTEAETDADLIAAFEAGAIPHERWGHLEHVRVAFIYLRAHPFAEALERLRTGIQALNRVHRVPESPTRGYHETLTVAWARLIAAAIEQDGPFDDSAALLRARPDLCGRAALHPHYSREVIMDPSAKTRFVEPDLAPLPESGANRATIGR